MAPAARAEMAKRVYCIVTVMRFVDVFSKKVLIITRVLIVKEQKVRERMCWNRSKMQRRKLKMMGGKMV